MAVGLGNGLADLGEPPEEAVAALREALEDESELSGAGRPLLREHAAWALRQHVGR